MIHINKKQIYCVFKGVNGGGGNTEVVMSPLPIEISTEAEMTALLATADIGSVYKYMGETTDTYANGALYILEAVSE